MGAPPSGGASAAAYPRHGKAHGGQIGGRRWSRFTHESSIVTRQNIWFRDQRVRRMPCEQKSHQRAYRNHQGSMWPKIRIFRIGQICAMSVCFMWQTGTLLLNAWIWIKLDDVCSTLSLVWVPAVACRLGRMYSLVFFDVL